MPKILLVEDDQNLSEIYNARLTAEGYTVISATNGEDALATAAKEKPDLVISDVMMPRVSGFEMLDILRHTDGLQGVKVIMLTALGQDNDRTKANELGADKYLVKSQVTLEDIISTAKELLGEDNAPEATSTTVASAPADPPTSQSAPPSPPALSISIPVSTPLTQSTVSPVSFVPTDNTQSAVASGPVTNTTNTGSNSTSLASDDTSAASAAKPITQAETELEEQMKVDVTSSASRPPAAPTANLGEESGAKVVEGSTLNPAPLSNNPSPATALPTQSGESAPSVSDSPNPSTTNAAAAPTNPTHSNHDEVLAAALRELEGETAPQPIASPAPGPEISSSQPTLGGTNLSTEPAPATDAPASSGQISGHKIIKPLSEPSTASSQVPTTDPKPTLTAPTPSPNPASQSPSPADDPNNISL